MITTNDISLSDKRYAYMNNFKEIIQLLKREENNIWSNFIDLLNDKLNTYQNKETIKLAYYIKDRMPELTLINQENNTFFINILIFTYEDQLKIINKDLTYLEKLKKQIINDIQTKWQYFYENLLNNKSEKIDHLYFSDEIHSFPDEFLNLETNKQTLDYFNQLLLYSVDKTNNIKSRILLFFETLSPESKKILSENFINEFSKQTIANNGSTFYSVELYVFEIDYESLFYLNPNVFYQIINRDKITVRFYYDSDSLSFEEKAFNRQNNVFEQSISELEFIKSFNEKKRKEIKSHILNKKSDMYDYLHKIS